MTTDMSGLDSEELAAFAMVREAARKAPTMSLGKARAILKSLNKNDPQLEEAFNVIAYALEVIEARKVLQRLIDGVILE